MKNLNHPNPDFPNLIKHPIHFTTDICNLSNYLHLPPPQKDTYIIRVNSNAPFSFGEGLGMRLNKNALPDESNYPYLRPMRLPNILLSVSLIIAASLANAQQFKVIKDTKEYKLMEVSSSYYNSHGIELKNDFVIDTSVIKKKNGVLRLPLLNGEFKEFNDTLAFDTINKKRIVYTYKGENKRLKLFLLYAEQNPVAEYYLINEKNGEVDKSSGMPYFSSSNKFYANSYLRHGSEPISAGVYFENLEDKATIYINMDSHYAYNFKWIDDYTFLFRIAVPNSLNNGDEGKRYFLVKAKKIK